MSGERTLPGLGLTGFWTPGTSGWDTGMDTNLRTLSAIVQGKVLSRTTTLPGSPTNGDIYIVPSGAGSHPNEVAIRDNGAWVYLTPVAGWRFYVADVTAFYYWTGSAWTAEALAWRGARVARTSDATGLTTGYNIVWQTADVDTDSFWSGGAPTRLTIPSGVSRVRFRYAVAFEALNTAGAVSASLIKNGSTIVAPHRHAVTRPRQGTTGFSNNDSIGFTAAIAVTPTDYYELQASWSMSGQDQVLNNISTWCEVEVLV